MGKYDFIYGSKMIIQCQAQLNILPWDGTEQPEFTKYLILIKKNSSFFTHWCKPRHGKIQITLKAPTFCARDMGITFDPQKYTYTVSN